MSDDEFELRNNAFNAEIESLKIKIKDLESQERTNADVEHSIETLRKVIAKELNFDEGFDNAIIDNLLDKIEVCRTNNNNEINIKVYIKVMDEPLEYYVNRGKNSVSVCSSQYI